MDDAADIGARRRETIRRRRCALPDALPSRARGARRRAVRGVRRRTICAASARWLEQPSRSGRDGAACAARPIAAASGSTAGDDATVPAAPGWEVVRSGREPAGAAAAPGRAGLRRQPVDAAIRDDLPAPDAGGGVAYRRRSSRGVRVLDVADHGSRRRWRTVGGGRGGPGEREGGRPVSAAPTSADAWAACWRRRTVTRCAARWWSSPRTAGTATPRGRCARAMARLRRAGAHASVWLNPRAAQPSFEPLAGSMAAALPYCDLLLPAHSLSGLRELFEALRTVDRPRAR